MPLVIALGGEGALEETAEHVQRVLPGIALVEHERLQDGQGNRLRPALALEFDGTDHGGSVREVSDLGEVTANFEIGIDALVNTPKDLHDQPVTEQDRRVALL